MAMTRTTLSRTAWTQITAGGDTDLIVVIEGGPARLCTGPASAQTTLGYNVNDGYQIILPAGVALHGIATGPAAATAANAVVGPFGA